MFAKPWERKSNREALDQAIADQTHQPWDPKPVPVPTHVKNGHELKRRMSQEPRPEKKFKKQAFAKAYLIDFDHRMAAIRIGADPDRALEIGRNLLNDPETLSCIQAFMARIESDHIISRERVLLGLLEEANYHGLGSSHSARVAAWAKLAKLIGMEQEGDDPGKRADTPPGGIMLVPYMGGIEEWERAAVEQQARLKADVRE